MDLFTLVLVSDAWIIMLERIRACAFEDAPDYDLFERDFRRIVDKVDTTTPCVQARTKYHGPNVKTRRKDRETYQDDDATTTTTSVNEPKQGTEKRLRRQRPSHGLRTIDRTKKKKDEDSVDDVRSEDSVHSAAVSRARSSRPPRPPSPSSSSPLSSSLRRQVAAVQAVHAAAAAKAAAATARRTRHKGLTNE